MAHSRAYAGDADLVRMQQLVADCWAARGPLVGTHVGDLPWRMYQHLGKLDEVRVQLWLDADDCVAWGWLWSKDKELDFEVHPGRPDLAAAVLEWAAADTVWALDSEAEAVAVIESAGYARDQNRWYEHHVGELERGIGEPPLPPGYSLRTVSDRDLGPRVDVHRAAFAPSRVVVESYARVQRAWPYRPELDHVVEAPDGSFAAFCLCWIDESNGAGLLEPVGTHPDHRRLGLASAVCTSGLRSLHEAGATRAVVLSVGGSAATGLYAKIGMPSATRHMAFRREANRPVERLRLGVTSGESGKKPRSGFSPVQKGTSMTTAVTESTFDQEVLASEQPVIVDFWAEWCGPCHAVSPVLDRIVEERSSELKLVKVNIDEEPSLAQRYGIASIPTIILFKGGEPAALAVGAQPKQALERSLGLVAA